MIQRTCPQCGHELVFKHGIYGQFIGCSSYPVCSFTMNEDGTPTTRKKEVVEWDEDGKPTNYAYVPLIKLKPVRKCPYKICDGSGLIPFKNKQGKVMPNCWVYCECHQAEPEHEHELRPGDFDYPMSFSVYRSLCREHGWQDPGGDRPETKELVAAVTNAPIEPVEVTDLRAQNQNILAQVRYLQNKVIEMRAKRGKSRGKY